MYVVLTVILLLILSSLTVFGQKRDTRDADLARIKKHMEMREELHRKMLENLMHGRHDENLFGEMEKLFEETMKEAGATSSFSFTMGQNVETEWQENEKGRTLLITPQTKDQKLDINVNGGMVTIKGTSENVNFQNSFSVPQDCDSGKVKMDQKEGKIVMFFPWLSLERKPMPKTKSDVAI